MKKEIERLCEMKQANKPKISNLSFYPIRPTDKGLIGFASCLFDNKLSLESIAVYTRADFSGFRCVFPRKQLPNGKEIAIFCPANKETEQAITQAVTQKIEEFSRKADRRNH